MRSLLTLFCCSAAFALAAAPPLKVLILTGASDLPYHHWRETTACLKKILEQSGRFEVSVNEEPSRLTAAALASCDVVAINYLGPRWPAAVEKALEDFVRSGKGLFAFHQASYGPFFGHVFRDRKWRDGPPGSAWSEFAKMIGATWDPTKLGHARRGEFTVEWKDPTHPLCRGLPATFVADDELYHRLTLLPGVQVLADAFSAKEAGGTGGREPQIWSNRYGGGRVLFTTLGHDAKAFARPGFAAFIARGLEWVASGEVAVPTGKP